MKKVILGIGLFALTFISVIPANAICRNPDGSIKVIDGNVYSGDNFDGSCSDCDYDCERPIIMQ
ncbi:hypothetical protein LZF95_22515 [Algoriphagus sp. AGSA1]|uniref:hypothetical protein n=1 Tax=Algoriphagus sp. AGSA1 TaxID=2907213 RepID=UPI001F37DE90|nr:hypothetical protein [Algoriphagus sp. AGSA1]MCE7057472.1 hypothetical protein [Algoriphagus sp. AGSA1]